MDQSDGVGVLVGIQVLCEKEILQDVLMKKGHASERLSMLIKNTINSDEYADECLDLVSRLPDKAQKIVISSSIERILHIVTHQPTVSTMTNIVLILINIGPLMYGLSNECVNILMLIDIPDNSSESAKLAYLSFTCLMHYSAHVRGRPSGKIGSLRQ